MAIDPGLATGVALFSREPFALIESEEHDWIGTARWADTKLRELGGENVDIVLEKFTVTQQTAKNSQQLWSVEIIGMLRLLSSAHGSGAITLQSPGDAKKFSTNPRLKSLGTWHVGGEGHANDAIRHGILRLSRTGWKDSRLLHD